MTNKAHLPIDPNTTRKDYPLYSGLLAYFPNALAYVSYVSKKANDQHNPGEPLHWAREKSTDHLDCLLRHLARAGERDEDGLLESGKVAWRALAQLETELEELREAVEPVKEKPKTLYDWNNTPPEITHMARSQFDGRIGGFKCKAAINHLHWFDIEARPT